MTGRRLLLLIPDLSSLPCAEHFQAWSQENRFHPQQQRVRVHLQLRVHRTGRRFPRQRSKQVDDYFRLIFGKFSRDFDAHVLSSLSRLLQDVTRGIDTSLTLKLQKRLTELEQEKQSLRNELENKEEQFQRARARVLTDSHIQSFILDQTEHRHSGSV